MKIYKHENLMLHIPSTSSLDCHQFLPLTHSTHCKEGSGGPRVSGQNGEQKITFPYWEMNPKSSSLWPVTLLTELCCSV